jgi:hypothetical protein
MNFWAGIPDFFAITLPTGLCKKAARKPKQSI